MTILDFWAEYTAPITGCSYTMLDGTGTVRTVVNTISERDNLVAAGWNVIATVER